jgi:PAS domain-containing protein
VGDLFAEVYMFDMSQREAKRVQAVNRFLNLEFSKEKELQEIVSVAAEICGTSTAAITLLGKDTQHLRFKHGLDVDTTSRADAFCHYVIQGKDVMVVPNALEDKRFVSNPFVSGGPNFRFYAGSPLMTHDGHSLGSLCVIDQTPKELSSLQKKMLEVLAKQVIQLMEFDETLQILKRQDEDAKISEIAMRSFFESSIDGHLLLGRNFEVLAYNKVWESHVSTNIGLHLEKGKSMVHFIHPENLSSFYKDYTKALKGTAVFVQRKTRIGLDYTWRIFKYEPAFDASGHIIGVTINTTDVTAKVVQNETLLAQGQSLREIALIQSHEFRKPVSSILGLMQILTLDGHTSKIKELQLMEQAVQELDEKIRLVVSHTNNPEVH